MRGKTGALAAYGASFALIGLLLVGCDAEPQPGASVASRSPYRLIQQDEKSSVAGTATIRGKIGVDGEGCVTVGPAVWVAPQSARLLKGGTIELGRQTFHQGDDVTLSGGFADAPAGSKCEPGRSFWWS